MGFICAICSESAEKNPGGAPDEQKQSRSNLSAAPCGHIFHSYCIKKWMSSSVPSSNLCPNCRKLIRTVSSCLDLFPDSYDEQNPTSPDPVQNLKCEHHEKEIASLRSKLYTLEADYKIQQSLNKIMTQDHHSRIAQVNEQIRGKEMQFETFKKEAVGTKNHLELEVQKLKAELQLSHHKIEAEKNERVSDHKKHMDYLQRVSSQVQAIQVGMLSHTLQFQRDSPYPKNDEPKAGPSRLSKPYKSRPSINNSKPRRGKKMVYEKGPEDEIEEVDLEESGDDDDFDIMAGPDSRKRKLICLRVPSHTKEIPKLKIKRVTSTELSLSPITLTLSSDTEDELSPNAVVTALDNVNVTDLQLQAEVPGPSVATPPEVEPTKMDISEG